MFDKNITIKTTVVNIVSDYFNYLHKKHSDTITRADLDDMHTVINNLQTYLDTELPPSVEVQYDKI